MKVFNVTWLKQSKDQQDYRKKEKKGKDLKETHLSRETSAPNERKDVGKSIVE